MIQMKSRLFVKRIKGVKIILEDLNGKRRRRVDKTETVIGKPEENERNNKGKRILQFCVENNFTRIVIDMNE